RRRHTRCYRDWSSDVCSSDLLLSPRTPFRSLPYRFLLPVVSRRPMLCWTWLSPESSSDYWAGIGRSFPPLLPNSSPAWICFLLRSEERRVGKECGFLFVVGQL